jgi:iron complex transport system ATP-binding protein
VSGNGARTPGKPAPPSTHGRYSQDPISHGALPGVQDVSLRLERGAVLGLLGPNGSGKTTLLRLLAGLLQPTEGRVLIDGLDLASIPRRQLARRMAVVPQETHLAFEYTVLEIALMGRYPHLGAFEFEGPRDLAIAREALHATGTAHLANRPFSTLSGGEKQRVIIASALAQEADILLLDEPTASLDLGYQLDVAVLLARLNRERGLTLVIATHDLNFAAGLCRTMLLLRDGRVLGDGLTVDVLTAASIAALYGVRADVRFHESAGHMTVVPLGRDVNSTRLHP